jgi:cytochrome P450
MEAGAPDLEALEIFAPDRYAAEGYPYAAWAQLRRHAPVFWYARNRVQPFWAITRFSDIVWISRQPERFLNAPHSIDVPAEPGALAYEPPPTIISMDPPEHGIYRQLTSRRFTPRALRQIEPEIDAIGREIVDALGADGREGECEFVERIAMPLPIAVIAWLLGVPRADWQKLFDWTNQLAGAHDPEYRRTGETATETRERANRELYAYFAQLVEDRRRRPTEDLVSLLAHARVDAAPLPPLELLSYLMILVVGGNETTRNATSGALLAFLEHPEQLELLRCRPELLDAAVEEVLRWTTPIVHMGRTAAADVELGRQKIRAGDVLALFYPSGNRDEAVFDEPFRFRIDRPHRGHLSFGIGEHYCLGSHLARLELRVVLRSLLRRLERAELAGPLERLRSTQVGGIKRLPIRYRLSA